MENHELLQAISQMIAPINTRLDKLDADIGQLKDDVSQLKNDVSLLKDDNVLIHSELAQLKNDNVLIHNEITSIKLTLENKIDRNIQLLAEGYLPMAKKIETISETTDLTKLTVDVIEKVVTKHSYEIQMLKRRAV